jgi:oligopeptide transport system permease protein
MEDFRLVGPDATKSETIYKPSLTFWQDAWRRFKQNKIALFFLFIILGFIFIAIFGQMFSKFQYMQQNLAIRFTEPFKDMKSGHWLGTDDFGRDVFVRLAQAIKVSMTLAIIVVAICVLIGTIYGAISAYFGGIVDQVMTRFVEIVMAIPSTIYIILLMVVLGNNLTTIIIAMAVSRWLNYSLLVRGEVLKLKETEYVLASRALGGNFWWIMIKHLIPNTLGIIIVRLTTDIPQIIFTEAFLSYIGLGVPIPQASLGNMVASGYEVIDSHLYLFIIPAIVISLITLAFNIVGDALSDALNPKLRNS